MKAGLGWDEFERPDQKEFEKFMRVCKLLSHPNPVVMLNRKYAIAKRTDGGFGFVFAMDVTNSSGDNEERWFGTDMTMTEFSQLCQTVSDEEIIEAMANKVLNEVKLGKGR
jgi:hypothetical protein